MQTIQYLVNAFIARIQYKAERYNELRVVFDRYLENSLKNKTRAKRATTGVYFDINFNSKFIMSLKDLLSSWKTKSRLSEMLAVSLVSYFANSPVELIVAYSDKILIKDISITHNHEEADTLIPNQLLSACAARPSCAVDIWSPDTDVLLLLMDLVSNDLISESSTVRFRNHHRSLNVRDCVTAVGKKKSQGLVGLHNFSGADWGGKLSGKTKKTWINKYVDLNEDDPIIGSFRELGTIQLPQSTDCTQYSHQVKFLVSFLCSVYSSNGPKTLSGLRWYLFQTKSLDGEHLPPTDSSFLPHLLRVNFICMRDKSYTNVLVKLPSLDENGWKQQGDTFVPVMSLGLPAPKAILQLQKCSCKTGCSTSRCSCAKNSLPCTSFCKCFATHCENSHNRPTIEDDDSDTEDQ